MIKISLSLLYFRLVTKEGPNFSEVSVDICGDQHNGLYSSREQKRSEEYCPASCMDGGE